MERTTKILILGRLIYGIVFLYCLLSIGATLDRHDIDFTLHWLSMLVAAGLVFLDLRISHTIELEKTRIATIKAMNKINGTNTDPDDVAMASIMLFALDTLREENYK